MSFNGSGTFQRTTSGTPYVSGSTISSTVVNNEMTDIATGLSTTICKDGQSSPTSNLPMATYRHTGVGNSAARTDYASAADVQDGTLIYLTAVAGTNTITATGANGLAAYAAGQKFHFIVANTNTGAVTLNINSVGAKAITKNGTTALIGGELKANAVTIVTYDGTQFQLETLNYGTTAITSYTRRSQTLARHTATEAAGNNSLSIGLNTIDVSSLTGATEVLVEIKALAKSASGVLLRYAQVDATDSGGINVFGDVTCAVYEFSSTANTTIGSIVACLWAPVSSTNIYLNLSRDAGGNSTAAYTIRGFRN